MKKFIIWLYRKRTGLQPYQLHLGLLLYYHISRSKVKAYWTLWNCKKHQLTTERK